MRHYVRTSIFRSVWSCMGLWECTDVYVSCKNVWIYEDVYMCMHVYEFYMKVYGFVWSCMDLYEDVWICMNVWVCMYIKVMLCTVQGPDWRVGDPAVPAARYAGGAAAGAAPDTDPQVPGQRGHRRLVPHLPLGRHLHKVRLVYLYYLVEFWARC